MHFLEYYYKTVIKYDFINTFFYHNLNEIPKLKKIILNFECKNLTIKSFVTILLTLELISSKKASITKAKIPNLFLKIQKANQLVVKLF